ncbi:MAG TPA: TatD family hydrolase [Methylomirabilota bacterium]|nr:TatD family hydrolase [Methylomirabilota bacterium]
MLFDTHAHLHFPEFGSDRGEMLARARAAGVRWMVNIGTDLETSWQAVGIAEVDPDIYASVGVHPHDAASADEAVFKTLEELARRPKVVAIGETGLDYYRNLSPRDVQAKVFRRQLTLARVVGKPVIIHCREAHDDLLKILREERAHEIGGVMHCFSGHVQFAEASLELGFYISIAGPVTYPNARKLPEVIKAVPVEWLVIETDCPFLPPQPHRGKRNEPAYLPITAQRVAEIKGHPVDELGELMSQNALRLFRIP